MLIMLLVHIILTTTAHVIAYIAVVTVLMVVLIVTRTLCLRFCICLIQNDIL